MNPDVSRLVDAVPGLMVEARRRAQAPSDLPSLLAARSWWAVPRLAVATGVVVVLASIALFVGRGTTTTAATEFDSVILDDSTGTNEGTGDVLLDAVLDAGRSDG
jgi:hypothetical protein